MKLSDIFRHKNHDADVYTVDYGLRVRLRPVAAFLIADVATARPDPQPPPGPEGQADYADPDYLRRLAETERARARAVNDALVMWGMQLLDPLPRDGAWQERLRWLERSGRLDLSGVDWQDDMELEFLFKKYVALTSFHLRRIGELTDLAGDDIRASLEAM